ncbi:hypothetical protein AGMMS50262_23650 [Bacteroidia bacterium]|nr:hypothetical protein AGMMS50262_23650 [Bacteroidia bacterium]
MISVGEMYDAVSQGVENAFQSARGLYEDTKGFWYDLSMEIPVYGAAQRSSDALSAGNYWGAADQFLYAAVEMLTLGVGSEIAQGTKTVGRYVDIAYNYVNKAAKGGTSGFRYMTEGELKAIQETGMLRGGRAGETYFTKDLYKSAASAPTLRVEFQILNNPNLLLNGTKVAPKFGMMGKGAEFMTLDPVKVRLINWQPLR